jgi:hypothetical protein
VYKEKRPLCNFLNIFSSILPKKSMLIEIVFSFISLKNIFINLSHKFQPLQAQNFLISHFQLLHFPIIAARVFRQKVFLLFFGSSNWWENVNLIEFAEIRKIENFWACFFSYALVEHICASNICFNNLFQYLLFLAWVN